jgi:hypothetical protein
MPIYRSIDFFRLGQKLLNVILSEQGLAGLGGRIDHSGWFGLGNRNQTNVLRISVGAQTGGLNTITDVLQVALYAHDWSFR